MQILVEFGAIKSSPNSKLYSIDREFFPLSEKVQKKCKDSFLKPSYAFKNKIFTFLYIVKKQCSFWHGLTPKMILYDWFLIQSIENFFLYKLITNWVFNFLFWDQEQSSKKIFALWKCVRTFPKILITKLVNFNQLS